MAISSPGIGSGLDVNNLVSQLMALERRFGRLQFDDQNLYATTFSLEFTTRAAA